MKRSDMAWIEKLARHATGKPRRNADAAQTVMAAVQTFLEELCTITTDYVSYFNEIVRAERPDVMLRVFHLGNARPGIMLLRGRDKLVISGEGGRIRARIVQVHTYGENSLDVMDFVANVDSLGDVSWFCASDGQRVNPDLVAKTYLGSFLASGSNAYLQQNSVMATADQRSPRAGH